MFFCIQALHNLSVSIQLIVTLSVTVLTLLLNNLSIKGRIEVLLKLFFQRIEMSIILMEFCYIQFFLSHSRKKDLLKGSNLTFNTAIFLTQFYSVQTFWDWHEFWHIFLRLGSQLFTKCSNTISVSILKRLQY